MNTDTMPDLKRGADSKLILKEETQRIIGHAFDVLNEVGHGLNEKIHENYLRITNLRVGLILNFKHARLEWERIVV